MGKGIDLCREDAPEHTALLDDFKDQLLIALIKRVAEADTVDVLPDGKWLRKVTIPVAEVDSTGGFVLAFSVKGQAFHFELRQKQ